MPTVKRRIRTSRLENAGQVAYEHARVFRELRRGVLEPSLASRLSAILVNHRTILETVDNEKRIYELEATLERVGQGNVVPLKVASGGQS